jgi:hypothetical protein
VTVFALNENSARVSNPQLCAIAGGGGGGGGEEFCDGVSGSQ